jgi:leucyl aminopeptidase (aminopeptidase T)
MFAYDYELSKAGDILCKDLFKLKAGEILVITADTESDMNVVKATASSAFACGAKPMVITYPSPLGVAEAADEMLPVEALVGALKGADAWVEFNNQWMLYSTPYNRAMKENKKLRYMNLVGMNPAMMVRLIGRVNYGVLSEFMDVAWNLTCNTKHFHLTTPAGGDVQFDYDAGRVTSLSKGFADKPGSHFLAGQIAWAPVFSSINGKIVFDGTIDPPLRKLDAPIHCTIEKGVITRVEGGREARIFESWMDSWNDPQMRRLAHVSWGWHPNALLTGDIVEDERVWGSTEWGVGAVGPVFGPDKAIRGASHTDGICLATSAWLDDVQLLDKGKVVQKDLVGLAKKLGK